MISYLPRMDNVKVNTALTSSLVLLSSLTKPVIGKRTGWASMACMCGRYYVTTAVIWREGDRLL